MPTEVWIPDCELNCDICGEEDYVIAMGKINKGNWLICRGCLVTLLATLESSTDAGGLERCWDKVEDGWMGE